MHSPCGHGLLDKFDPSPTEIGIPCRNCGKKLWVREDSVLCSKSHDADKYHSYKYRWLYKSPWGEGTKRFEYYYCHPTCSGAVKPLIREVKE